MAYETIPTSGALSVANAAALAGMAGDWFVAMDAFVIGKLSTLVCKFMRSELGETTMFSTVAVAGTGVASVASTATENGGVLRLAGGATAGGTGQAIKTSFVTNIRTQIWGVAVRAKIVAAPAGTGLIRINGLTDEATSDTGLVLRPATSLVNYTTETGGVYADTGVAFDASYHDIVTIADATNITYYVDTVAIATVAQVGATNGNGRLRIFAGNGDQNANAETRYDKLALYCAAAV